jgi:hypothetical protein
MPQNFFSNTGILDGQIVEANQVSQSVDAFTGAKDYRITLTGSMELSGSLLMSGSLINEYSGQFSTLGLGTGAPTAPTMLYIKDTSTGEDPVIIIEDTNGNDSARIRLKNPDVEYDLGAFGSKGDAFMVIQDSTSSPAFPFVVEKDTVSYTLYAVDDSVGVGLGANTKVILNPLDAGSIQAAGRISGSSMRAGIISASAAGENIHGTASYATYIETAQTASYVKAENVDFFYSISQQINSAGEIAALSGSYDALKISDVSGLSIKNEGQTDYSIVLSGSVSANQGKLFFGDVDGGEYLTFDQLDTQIIAETAKFNVPNELLIAGNINLSGSTGAVSTRKLVIGPDAASGTINSPSASLGINDLAFNRNNVAYIGNYNTSGTSKLALSAGGGGGASFTNIELSASGDVTMPNGQLIMDGTDNPSSLTDLQTYMNFDPVIASSGFQRRIFRSKAIETNSSTGVTAFRLDSNNMPTQNGIYHITFECIGTNGGSTRMCYMKREKVAYWSGTNSRWEIQYSGTGALEKIKPIYFNNVEILFDYNGYPSPSQMNIKINNADTTTVKWNGLITIQAISTAMLS